MWFEGRKLRHVHVHVCSLKLNKGREMAALADLAMHNRAGCKYIHDYIYYSSQCLVNAGMHVHVNNSPTITSQLD